MGDKRFSQVVDWNKHIEPYRIIQFVAGVGSGKYWVVFKKTGREKRLQRLCGKIKYVLYYQGSYDMG